MDFRSQGHALVDQLADYLERVSLGEGPVLPWREPEAMCAQWPERFPSDEPLAALWARAIVQSNHLHHRGYVGHQVTAPLPEAALCDLLTSLLNNSAAVYEMGPVAMACERAVVRFFTRAVGFPEGAGGVFTSGGSAGNLTALLAARQAKAGFDAWRGGLHAGPPLAFLVPEQAHYCLARALQIMGLGAEGAWPVACDAQYRLRADALGDAQRAAERAGRRVIGVCASAGSTATGAFDPLAAVADYCEPRGLWLHVDGAHGASAALSTTHRHRLAGLERADSLVWDAHKMMRIPALCTVVLFRDARRGYEAFTQEAGYLFTDASPEEQWFNLGKRTLECTKPMMAFKLYAMLATRGPAYFGAYLDACFAQAQRFAARVRATPELELAVEPDCNIVCFRVRALDAVGHTRLRQRLLEAGRFYLVQTVLDRGMFLRVTLLDPSTADDDLEALLRAVLAG